MKVLKGESRLIGNIGEKKRVKHVLQLKLAYFKGLYTLAF